MKKFLSLVMALVMTMSLVTIGAGATEYEDLSDKSEIQYEEAVAVLNKLGIISGYEDGSFRPTGALTRGAAAKIIVSLMIGTEAANALTVSAAPYSDVPVTNTFAAVISYCKTAGYINGYTDGTFRPTAALTGYAFTKMLLGALGYDGKQEGFTGEGWIMNVSKLGNTAGLFNDFKTAFKGNDGVNREQACQLALNTLKATMVEYSGGTNITTSTGDATTTVNTNKVRSYVTSNNANINQNINKTNAGNQANYYTLEFGEEHFQDLILVSEGGAYDDFGRPSNEWSYKKVKVGTFPHTPDFSYTEQMTKVVDGDSVAVKAKALGLKGYVMDAGVRAVVNGVSGSVISEVGDIADYTDYGATVEVYLNDKSAAQTITDVVVVKTQLMQVNKVGSDYVSLKLMKDDAGTMITYNNAAIQVNVNDVKDDDDVYATLKDLKSDDYVVVTPLYNNSSKYDVSSVYVPTTATGDLTKVTTYNKYPKAQTGVTVGGTDYNVAQWNQLFDALDAAAITATKKDVTVYLDSFGYAMLIKDAGASSDYMVVKGEYQTLVNNKMVTMLEGWDKNGDLIALNLGTSAKMANTANIYGTPNYLTPGDLVTYTTAGTTNEADYVVSAAPYTVGPGNKGILTVDSDHYDDATPDKTMNSSDTKIYVDNDGTDDNDNTGTPAQWYYASGVKFFYVTYDTGSYPGGVAKSVTVKTGAQNVDAADLANAQVYVKTSNGIPQVNAVVIMKEANDAISTSMLYVRDTKGSQLVANGSKIYGYTVDMNTKDGVLEEQTIYSYKQLNQGDFASYTLRTDVEGYTDNFYDLTKTTNLQKTTSVAFDARVSNIYGVNNNLLDITGALGYNVSGSKVTITTAMSSFVSDAGVDGTMAELNTRNAQWVDLTGNSISSAKDLKDFTLAGIRLDFVFNDNTSSDNYGSATYIIVTKVGTKIDTTNYALPTVAGLGFYSDAACTTAITEAQGGSTVYVKSTVGGQSLTALSIAGVTVTGPNGSYVWNFTMPSKALFGSDVTSTTTAIGPMVADDVKISGTTINLGYVGDTYGASQLDSQVLSDAQSYLIGLGYSISEIGDDSTNWTLKAQKGDTTYNFKAVAVEAFNLTVAAGDVIEYSLTASPFTKLTNGTHAFNENTVFYARSTTALQKLTAASGVTVGALQNTIDDATDQAVYAVTITDAMDGTTSTMTAAAEWFTVTVTEDTVQDADNEFDFVLAANASNVAVVQRSSGTATITVTVTSKADTNPTIVDSTGVSVAATNGTVGTPAISGGDNLAAAIGVAANGKFTVVAGKSVTSGASNTYTVAVSGVTTNTTISIA